MTDKFYHAFVSACKYSLLMYSPPPYNTQVCTKFPTRVVCWSWSCLLIAIVVPVNFPGQHKQSWVLLNSQQHEISCADFLVQVFPTGSLVPVVNRRMVVK